MRRSIAAILASLAATTALAQTTRPPTPHTLEPVDATFEDMNPLRTSTRLVRPDLRLPTGFDRVYRLPGSSRSYGLAAGASTEDRFVRISGGLAAVFNSSDYDKDKKGRTLAVIPAGTVYHIGGPPQPPPEPRRVSPEFGITALSQNVDTFVARDVNTGPVAMRVDMTAAPTTIALQPDSSRLIPMPESAPEPSPAPDAAGSSPTPPTPTPPAPASRKPEPVRVKSPRPATHVLTDEIFRRQRVRALLLTAAESPAPTNSAPASR